MIIDLILKSLIRINIPNLTQAYVWSQNVPQETPSKTSWEGWFSFFKANIKWILFFLPQLVKMENRVRLVSVIFQGHIMSTKSHQHQGFTNSSQCPSKIKCSSKDSKRSSQLSLLWSSIFLTDNFMELFQLSLKNLKSSKKKKRNVLFMKKPKSMKKKFDIWKWWKNLTLREIFPIKRN